MSLIQEINEFSKNKLKRKEDLELILNAASNDKKLFADLIFNAKYVMGLQRVLKQNTTNNEDAKFKVQQDYSSNLMKIIEQLKIVANNFQQKDKFFFEQNYLQLNHSSLNNLNELLSDLEWVKMYINDLKHRQDKN
ncbi:MAG TPA: hypothetical protein VFF33_00410 [Ignavibacteriaceae bacterium]|nr:hypothetical protein [Ignavibacteriaceae bacterium]